MDLRNSRTAPRTSAPVSAAADDVTCWRVPELRRDEEPISEMSALPQCQSGSLADTAAALSCPEIVCTCPAAATTYHAICGKQHRTALMSPARRAGRQLRGRPGCLTAMIRELRVNQAPAGEEKSPFEPPWQLPDNAD